MWIRCPQPISSGVYLAKSAYIQRRCPLRNTIRKQSTSGQKPSIVGSSEQLGQQFHTVDPLSLSRSAAVFTLPNQPTSRADARCKNTIRKQSTSGQKPSIVGSSEQLGQQFHTVDLLSSADQQRCSLCQISLRRAPMPVARNHSKAINERSEAIDRRQFRTVGTTVPHCGSAVLSRSAAVFTLPNQPTSRADARCKKPFESNQRAVKSRRSSAVPNSWDNSSTLGYRRGIG